MIAQISGKKVVRDMNFIVHHLTGCTTEPFYVELFTRERSVFSVQLPGTAAVFCLQSWQRFSWPAYMSKK